MESTGITRGNLLQTLHGTIVTVESISEIGINMVAGEGFGVYAEHDWEELAGLPLTEEWLNKTTIHCTEFGYIFGGGDWRFNDGRLSPNPYYTSAGYPTGFYICFVHELQNLYFTITKTELTIK